MHRFGFHKLRYLVKALILLSAVIATGSCAGENSARVESTVQPAIVGENAPSASMVSADA